MCTVTFVPGLAGGGYLLASNRDESPGRRPGLPPYAREMGRRLVLAPRDADAGGTWIGVGESGRALCLLNGDRPAAAPAPADARSRGLLVDELLADPRPAAVRAELERRAADGRLRFKPFKLVVVEPGAPARGAARGATGPAPAAWLLLAEWDGAALRFGECRAACCVVSSTHRSDEVGAARRAAFESWLAGQAKTVTGERLAESLADFHAGHAPGATEGDAFSVCMHREDARTVSRTLVHVRSGDVRMRYQAGWPCRDGEEWLATLPRR